MIEGNHADEGTAAIPDGIKHWNWGAFLIPWIWAMGNKVWIGLFALIPAVGLVTMAILSVRSAFPLADGLAVFFAITGLLFSVFLGIKGDAWAWRSKAWRSVGSFRKAQRIWACVGLVVVMADAAGIWYVVQQIAYALAMIGYGGGG